MRLSTRTSPSMSSMVFPLRSALKLKEISESTYLSDRLSLLGRKLRIDA